MLNIAGHYVSSSAGGGEGPSGPKKIHGPVDCEGHLGSDGRFYVIDPARLFPPEPSTANSPKGSKLYKLLRPELVKKSPNALCSDSFSNFQLQNRDPFEFDVSQVHRNLLEKVIPEFARGLAAKVCAWWPTTQPKVDDFRALEVEAHQQGINIRFLASVRQSLPPEADSRCHRLLVTLLLGRVLKNLIRAHMRALKSTQSSSYTKLIVTYFNLIFGAGDRSGEFWRIHLKDRVLKTFPGLLTPSEVDGSDLRSSVDPITLFHWLQTLIGVGWSLNLQQLFDKLPTESSGTQTTLVLNRSLVEGDVTKVYPIVKYTNRLAFEQGTALSRKALGGSKGRSEAFFKQAEENFKVALQIKPDDVRALHNWSLSLMHQASQSRGEEADTLYQIALEKLEQATRLAPADPRTSLLSGNCLLQMALRTKDLQWRQSLLVRASEKFDRSLKSDPNNVEALYNWGNALLHRSSLEPGPPLTILRDAVAKFKAAVAMRPKSANSLFNLAVTLAKYARAVYLSNSDDLAVPDAIYKEAGDKFEVCLAVRPNDREALFNWGNALFRQAKMHEKSEDYRRAFDLCVGASEKYLGALDLKLNYYEALYNWANVVKAQSDMPITSLEAEFAFSTNYFLEVFRKVALKYPDHVTLEPLVALIQSHRGELRRKVFGLLNFFSAAGRGRLQTNANRTLKEILTQPDAKDFLEESAGGEPSDPNSQLPILSSTIIQTIGAGDVELREAAESGVVSLDRIDFTRRLLSQAPLLHHAPFRLYRGTNNASLERYSLILVDKDALYQRIGIESRLELQREERNQVRREYFQCLKQSRPFSAPVSQLFATEEDEFCLIYKPLFNPSCHLLSAVENKRREESSIRFYAAELVVGLEAIHTSSMFYGPLDGREVLVDKSGHVLLHFPPFFSASAPTAGLFQPEYLPPEVLAGQESYQKSSDWYCLGILLAQLVLGEVPFHGESLAEVYSKIATAGGIETTLPATTSGELKSLIAGLLAKDPSQRKVTWAKIKYHAFFSGIRWETFQSQQLPTVPYVPSKEDFDTINGALVPTVVATPLTGQYRGFSFAQPK